MKQQFENLVGRGRQLKKDLRPQVISYVTAALALVAGLAWNEAVKSLIDYFWPFSGNGPLVKLAYAVITTILVVIVGRYLAKREQALS